MNYHNQYYIFFQSLMREFLPNVSEDYVFGFYLECRKGLFSNVSFLRLFFSFYPKQQYFLCVKFIDGKETYYKLSSQQLDYWQDKLENINHFLDKVKWLN